MTTTIEHEVIKARFGEWERERCDGTWIFVYDYKVEPLVPTIDYSVRSVDNGKWAIEAEFSYDVRLDGAYIHLYDDATTEDSNDGLFDDPAEAMALVNAEIERNVESARDAVVELRL